MKIGLFTDQYYPNISGVVTSIKVLYEGLEELGHEVFIFTSYDESSVDIGDHILQTKIVNLPGKPYPFESLKDYRYSKKKIRIVETIAKYDLDIIHVHTDFNIAKIAIKASKKLGIPIVHTLHTLYEDYLKYISPFFDRHFHTLTFKFLAKIYVEAISKRSEINIVPTEKVKKMACKYYIKGDIRVVPTGIELGRFDKSNFKEQDKNNLRLELGIQPDQFVFGYIGRTSSEKNIKLIIKAFSKIKDSNKAVLIIVGGGPELEELKTFANVCGVSQRVLFTGFIPNENIPIYYQILDVFVNASKSETQGLTYLESLASSVPILVQKDDCINEVVIDGFNGIYFDGLEELIIKMEEILNNSQLLKKISENAKKSVEKYSKECYASSVEGIYEAAIAKYKNKKKR